MTTTVSLVNISAARTYKVSPFMVRKLKKKNLYSRMFLLIFLEKEGEREED